MLALLMAACGFHNTMTFSADVVAPLSEVEKGRAMELEMAQLLMIGGQTYSANCVVCHGRRAMGIPGFTKPLHNSHLVADSNQMFIRFVLFNQPRLQHHPAWFRVLTPISAAALLTYIRVVGEGENKNPIQPSEVLSELEVGENWIK